MSMTDKLMRSRLIDKVCGLLLVCLFLAVLAGVVL